MGNRYKLYEDFKKCRKCGMYIDIMATECEYCGEKYDVKGDMKKVFIFVIVAGLAIGLLSIVPYSDIYHKYLAKDEPKVTTAAAYRLNEPFISEDEKATMIEADADFKDYTEYGKPKEGYKFVMAKFEIENISKENEKMFVNAYDFQAYADNVAANRVYTQNEKYEEISANITNGKKAIGYVFFEVPTGAEKITITYSTIAWKNQKDIEFVING